MLTNHLATFYWLVRTINKVFITILLREIKSLKCIFIELVILAVLKKSSCIIIKTISGQVDKASATKAVDSGSILDWVKPNSTKIGIDSFPAWRSAIKGTVWSLCHVW